MQPEEMEKLSAGIEFSRCLGIDDKDGGAALGRPHVYYGFIGFGPGLHSGPRDLPLWISTPVEFFLHKAFRASMSAPKST